MKKSQLRSFDRMADKSPINGVLTKWCPDNRTFWAATPDMIQDDIIEMIFDLLQEQWGFAGQMFSNLRNNRATLIAWIEEDGKVIACQMLAWQKPLLIPEASFEARLLTFELCNNALDPAFGGQNLDSWLVHIMIDRGLGAFVKKALAPQTVLIKRSEVVYGTPVRITNASLKYFLGLGKIILRGVFDETEEELRLRISGNLSNTQYMPRFNDNAKAMTNICDGTIIYQVNPDGGAMIQKILTAPINGLRHEETETFEFVGEGHAEVVQNWADRFKVFPEEEADGYKMYVVSLDQGGQFGSNLDLFSNFGFSVIDLLNKSKQAAAQTVEEARKSDPNQKVVFIMPTKKQNTQVWSLKLPPMAIES